MYHSDPQELDHMLSESRLEIQEHLEDTMSVERR